MSGSRERKLAGSARARNRRHRAIMPGIQIADDSTGERNSMGSAGIDERSSGVSVCPRDGREGVRVHRAWTSASPVTRRPGRLKIFNFRLTEDSPTKRLDPCSGCIGTQHLTRARVLCRRSRWRQQPWLKKEMKWLMSACTGEGTTKRKEEHSWHLARRTQSRICKMKFSRT